MRPRLRAVLALALLVVTATAALSQAVEAPTYQPSPTPTAGESPEIALEVYCYLDDLDVPQPQAQADCSRLGEFGLTWEQTLDVLDAAETVLATVVPQVVIGGDSSAPFPADGAWIAPTPVLPEGWTVIECPFLSDDADTVTNGVGQVLEAERLSYQDRRHVVCYEFRDEPGGATPGATGRPTEVPRPTRIDTGGGGTAPR